MAGKSGKSKENSSGIWKFYLIAYNAIVCVGWAYVLCLLIRSYFTNDFKDFSLWDTVRTPLMIFQNAAVLEVIHASVGLVKSNPIITAFQVASRVVVVCGVLQATPPTAAASSLGLPILLCAWSITEIIRYGYYFANLINFVPRLLVWLRYTLFIVLYPLGVTGEMLCYYAATSYGIAHPGELSYTLPNVWNFTFSYPYFIILTMLLYIPLFPQMYLHMFSQRKKILGTSATSKAEKIR